MHRLFQRSFTCIRCASIYRDPGNNCLENAGRQMKPAGSHVVYAPRCSKSNVSLTYHSPPFTGITTMSLQNSWLDDFETIIPRFLRWCERISSIPWQLPSLTPNLDTPSGVRLRPQSSPVASRSGAGCSASDIEGIFMGESGNVFGAS